MLTLVELYEHLNDHYLELVQLSENENYNIMIEQRDICQQMIAFIIGADLRQDVKEKLVAYFYQIASAMEKICELLNDVEKYYNQADDFHDLYATKVDLDFINDVLLPDSNAYQDFLPIVATLDLYSIKMNQIYILALSYLRKYGNDYL